MSDELGLIGTRPVEFRTVHRAEEAAQVEVFDDPLRVDVWLRRCHVESVPVLLQRFE